MFHAVYGLDPDDTVWEDWRSYLIAHPELKVVSQNDPTSNLGTALGSWAQRISTAWDYDGSNTDESAASALATRINAITSTGRHCVIDEIHGAKGGYDPIPMITLSMDEILHPHLVHFYVVSGRYVSYEDLDASDTFPVFTSALAKGIGLLLEMYIPQPEAERSEDISAFISNWYLGPGGSRMPYMLALAQELESPSALRFVYPVIDRFFKGTRKNRLSYGKFMDLVLQRGSRSYPSVFANGICTWVWDSRRISDPNRDQTFINLHQHYTTGRGHPDNGSVRYFAPAGA